MEISATAKYIRTSTRKVRLIADAVRNLTVDDALNRLGAMAKHAAQPLSVVLASALSNAKNKNVVDTSTLRIKHIEVMGGPVMKRFRAVSRGQAHAYKKRMTHIRVVLTDDSAENRQHGAKGGNG